MDAKYRCLRATCFVLEMSYQGILEQRPWVPSTAVCVRRVLEMGCRGILEHRPWVPKLKLWGPQKRGQNEAKMEPRGTQNEPKVDKSGTKGEVWDHM